MKVKELIEELQKLDQEVDIVVYHEDGHDYVAEPMLSNDVIFYDDDSGNYGCEKNEECKHKAFLLMGLG